MKKRMTFLVTVVVILSFLLLTTLATAQTKAPQLVPKRLSSTGDSITEAIDAELPLANHWASWVNGYHGFWEWLFGLTNVNSHNQRITKIWGPWGRKNYMEAKSGADMPDFAAQAAAAVAHQASYVTVFMGHNDVCGNDFTDIPSDSEFEANFKAGMEILKGNPDKPGLPGLPVGATVYVIGIVDIYQLWEVAQDKKALGIVDCEVLWATTLLDLFPCGTMLNPLIGPAGRDFTRGRNAQFNAILKAVTEYYSSSDSNHHYFYTDVVTKSRLDEHWVSDIDCFHPSALGQKVLSDMTWTFGPFSAYK